MANKKPLGWVFTHAVTIVCVAVSLTTGFRIATLNNPTVLAFSGLLPQGGVHKWHIVSAACFTALALVFTIYQCTTYRSSPKNPSLTVSTRYHRCVMYFLYLVLTTTLLTGWWMFFGFAAMPQVIWLHFLSALGMGLYILFHGGAYFIEYGAKALERIALFSNKSAYQFAICIVLLLGAFVIWRYLVKAPIILPVHKISNDIEININGVADEAIWDTAKTISVMTHGGANFVNGATEIRVRALRTDVESYFHFTWQDSTESLDHLPLLKTEQGWEVQQNGFHVFDEQEYYEDKFAVMLSNDCELAASGSAHLGPKPIKDKPTHWTGKGYHYTHGKTLDVWHWKAVRTNNMGLMDDNYFASPDKIRAGERRYTAGYYTDAKESGSYKMNWRWYQPGTVIPKRLPLHTDMTEVGAYLPWFDTKRYSKRDDDYALGSKMPSILYLSNRFEGDRADVRAAAIWQQGVWHLEVFRKLDTTSDKDVVLQNGVCMWLAAFDRSQIAHTRHVRALQLRFQ